MLLTTRIIPAPSTLARALCTLALAGLLGAAAPAQAAPKRIVALTPFTANTLAELGVRPAAIGATVGGDDHFNARLKGVRRLPLSHPNGPNLEQLAALKPQLVLSAPIWDKGNRAIRGLGISVTNSDPQRVAQVASETRRIGALVGRGSQAGALATRQAARIAQARRGAKRHPKVLLVLGVGRTSYAFLPNSWGGDLVTQAGGTLATKGLRATSGFAPISDEYVLAQNPDVIIAVPHGNPGDIPKLVNQLASKPAWKNTTAVRRKQLYISTDNTLLQAYTDPGGTIYKIQTRYLHNR